MSDSSARKSSQQLPVQGNQQSKHYSLAGDSRLVKNRFVRGIYKIFS
jgi:hypothetical protein